MNSSLNLVRFTLAAAIFVASATAQAQEPVAPTLDSDGGTYAAIGAAAKFKLGVYLTPIQYYEPRVGGNVNALRVDRVVKGSPALKNGLEPGDIITRVDGTPVRNLIDLRNQFNASNGTVTLRIRDIRSGTYSDMPNVVLDPVTAPTPSPDPGP